MSRVTDFDDAYADSRGRLLLQLYAYCGDAEAADDALNEAYITASRHWHRIRNISTRDAWLRSRAIKRLDGRPRSAPTRRERSKPNAHLLAALAALDPTSRRLLIVRRLGGDELSAAAHEVGLTVGVAEQALARATTALHANGVDTAPASLAAALGRLGDDLERLDIPAAASLRRAGARRRYAAGTVLAVVLVAAAAGAGMVSAASPTASEPPPTHHPSPPSTTTTTTPTMPPPQLGTGSLVTQAQVDQAGAAAGWRVLPAVVPPTTTSIYGDCIDAADNPPPDTSWIRDFATGTGPGRAELRQVLQLAPSPVEAQRAYRQIYDGFTLCGRHQLVDVMRVSALGERTHFVRLRESTADGPVVENIVMARTGDAVSFLTTSSPPGKEAALSPAQLIRLAGDAVNRLCTETASGCAFPPYAVVEQRPPADPAADGFLSVVDLPLVPHVAPAWVATEPNDVVTNPSATPCDRTDFTGGGGSGVRSRSYVIPRATALPTLFGLTETRAQFASSGAAKAFVEGVARNVAGCHKRQLTLAVLHSTAFSSHRMSGRVWEIRQKVSKKKVVTFRVALVRIGRTVAQVTFTPVGEYDVEQVEFVALARRAAVRLHE